MLTEEQKEYIRINFRQGKEKIAETLKCPYDDVAYFFRYGLMRNKEVQKYYKDKMEEMKKTGFKADDIAKKLEITKKTVYNNITMKKEKVKRDKDSNFKLPDLDSESAKIWAYIKKKSQENKIAVMDMKISCQNDIKKLDNLIVRNLIEKLEPEKSMCVRIKVVGEI